MMEPSHDRRARITARGKLIFGVVTVEFVRTVQLWRFCNLALRTLLKSLSEVAGDVWTEELNDA